MLMKNQEHPGSICYQQLQASSQIMPFPTKIPENLRSQMKK